MQPWDVSIPELRAGRAVLDMFRGIRVVITLW